MQEQASQLRLKCENEAQTLNSTILYDDFISECLESGYWYKSEVDTNQMWLECITMHNYTVYDQCLVDNSVERSKMMPTNNCFFEKVGAFKSGREIDTYRLVAVDERYLNQSKASLYVKYKKCIDSKWEPFTDKDALDLYKCFCVDVKYFDRVTETLNVTNFDMQCRSRCSPDAYDELINNNRVDENNVNYIRCLMEKLHLIENDCYFVERDIEFVGDRRTALEQDKLRKCFREAIGEFNLNFVQLFQCGFKLQFYI